MRRRDHVKKEENVSYWQSYSDMMAALLLIFVLVIAVAIVALNDYKEKLAEQNEELLARQDLLEKQADEAIAQCKASDSVLMGCVLEKWCC